MTVSLRIKDGLVKRLREIYFIRSEEAFARLIGCDRMTLRRIEQGAQPSGGFVAQFCVAFQLGIGEAFEIVESEVIAHRAEQVATAPAPAMGGLALPAVVTQ